MFDACKEMDPDHDVVPVKTFAESLNGYVPKVSESTSQTTANFPPRSEPKLFDLMPRIESFRLGDTPPKFNFYSFNNPPEVNFYNSTAPPASLASTPKVNDVLSKNPGKLDKHPSHSLSADSPSDAQRDRAETLANTTSSKKVNSCTTSNTPVTLKDNVFASNSIQNPATESKDEAPVLQSATSASPLFKQSIAAQIDRELQLVSFVTDNAGLPSVSELNETLERSTTTDSIPPIESPEPMQKQLPATPSNEKSPTTPRKPNRQSRRKQDTLPLERPKSADPRPTGAGEAMKALGRQIDALDTPTQGKSSMSVTCKPTSVTHSVSDDTLRFADRSDLGDPKILYQGAWDECLQISKLEHDMKEIEAGRHNDFDLPDLHAIYESFEEDIVELTYHSDEKDKDEANWNHIHWSIGLMATKTMNDGNIGSKARLTFEDVTHRKLKQSVKRTIDPEGQQTDFVIAYNPEDRLIEPMNDLVRSLGEKSDSNINVFKSKALKTQPVSVAIETKSSIGLSVRAETQVKGWACATYVRLHRLMEKGRPDCVPKLPPLPMLFVNGGTWWFYFVCCDVDERGKGKYTTWRRKAVGDTHTKEGVEKVIRTIQLSMRWTKDCYMPWFVKYVLGVWVAPDGTARDLDQSQKEDKREEGDEDDEEGGDEDDEEEEQELDESDEDIHESEGSLYEP